MLKVTSGPAIIPGQFVRQCGRRFFETVTEVWFHPNLIAGPAQVGRPDKVMAHNGPTEQAEASQFAQTTVRHAGLDPDACVVAPERGGPHPTGSPARGRQR